MANPMIEFRERCTGAPLTCMPLYEFLASLHTRLPASDEYAFEDLEILLDGQPVLPGSRGNA
jgi:hypothetical protein